jgi:hypothetical protein
VVPPPVPAPGLVLVLPLVEEPDVPLAGEPAPVERLVEEPDPAVPEEYEPPGAADGDPASSRPQATVPNATASAKNAERALVMSHLLRPSCHADAKSDGLRRVQRLTKLLTPGLARRMR